MEDYQIIVAELNSLRNEVADLLTKNDKTLFDEFVYAGEYTLALEEITGGVIEGNHAVSKSIFAKIERLAKQLTIRDEHWKPIKVHD